MGKTATVGSVEFERYIQSSFRIQSGDVVVYVDPHRIDEGPQADLILITHEHFDHMDVNSINALDQKDTLIIGGERVVKELTGRVSGQLVPIREGASTAQKGIEVKAVPGYNSNHPRGLNLGYVFRVGDQTIYHAGDTDHVPEMANLGPIDVALLPIGGTYAMNEEAAAAAVRVIRPKVTIPMHYGYATGGDSQKFVSLVGSDSIVIVL